MVWLVPAVISTFAGSLILTFVYFFLYSQEEDRFLLIWAISWLIYSLRFVIILVNIRVGDQPWLTAANHTSSLVSGIFLLWGAYQFLGRDFSLWWWVGGAAGFIWIFTAAFTRASVLITTLPIFTYVSGIYIWTGITLISTPMTTGASKKLTGWAFILWGIHKADFPFLRTAAWFAPWGFLLSAGLELIVAVGMLSVYYEVHRKELAESEERFNLAVLGSKDGIWDWQDLSQEQYWWSDRIFEMLDYTPGAFQPTRSFFVEKVHPEDREKVRRVLDDHLQRNLPYQVDFRIRKSGGEYIWMYTRGESIRDEQGKPTRLAGSVTDITRRVEVENSLRDSKERYLSLFNSIRDAILVTDTDRRIINCNPAFVDLFGYTLEDIIGKKTDMIYENLEEFGDLGEELDKRRGEENFIYVVKFRKKTGEIFSGETNVFFRNNREGETIGFIGLIRDISDRLQAEQELLEYRNHLEELVNARTVELEQRVTEVEQLNRELESFAYTVAHDLRAPLRHIDSFAAVLRSLEHDQLENKSLDYLDKIINSANRMGKLIDDLLAFSRTGRTELKLSRVAPEQIIDRVLKEIEPDLEGRDITWDIDSLPAVYADPKLLWLVWNNLLSNAVKYTRSRSEARIEIGIGAHPNFDDEGMIVFYIRDNGIGFDMDYIDKIFGVFQRLHSSEQFEGTGIGLATVRRVVNRHGGRVWAEGKVDEGATFYFSLPEA